MTQKNTKQSSDSAQFRGIIPHRMSKLSSEKLVIFDPYEKFLCILGRNQHSVCDKKNVLSES